MTDLDAVYDAMLADPPDGYTRDDVHTFFARHHPSVAARHRRRLLRTVELFAGVGGFSLGAMRAGCTISLGIERNADAVRTGRANRHRMTQADVGDLELYRDVTWDVDLLIGGPPCQPFTEMGVGEGPRNATWMPPNPRTRRPWACARCCPTSMPRRSSSAR